MWNISAGSLVENGDEFQDGHCREANQRWALLKSGACANSTGGPPRKLTLGNCLTDSADPYGPFCALDPQALSLLYVIFWLNVCIHLQLQCLSLEGRAISPYNLALALCWHTVCGLLMEIFPKDWGGLYIIIARYMSQHPGLAVKLRSLAPGSYCSKYHPLLQSIYLPLPSFPHSSNLFGLSQYTVLLHIICSVNQQEFIEHILGVQPVLGILRATEQVWIILICEWLMVLVGVRGEGEAVLSHVCQSAQVSE